MRFSIVFSLLVSLMVTSKAQAAANLSEKEVDQAVQLCYEDMISLNRQVSINNIAMAAQKKGIKLTKYYRASSWESSIKVMNPTLYPYYLKYEGNVCFFNLEDSSVNTFLFD